MVIGYIRVSTEEQATEGYSLHTQSEMIKEYCRYHHLAEPEIITDAGCSAKNLNRPGIQEILARIERGEVSDLVVLKLDRLTRNLKDLLNLVELFNARKVNLHSRSEEINTKTANGKMVLSLLGMLAQWERDKISERTKEVLQQKIKDGARLGPPQYKNEEVLAEIKRRRKRNESYAAIARRLNDRNIPAPKGKKWYPATVRLILRLPFDKKLGRQKTTNE